MSDPQTAVVALGLLPKKAALVFRKTLTQAIANATFGTKTSADLLRLQSLVVHEGPTLKRVRFGGRGRVKPILKRTSRVVVTLSAPEEIRSAS